MIIIWGKPKLTIKVLDQQKAALLRENRGLAWEVASLRASLLEIQVYVLSHTTRGLVDPTTVNRMIDKALTAPHLPHAGESEDR